MEKLFTYKELIDLFGSDGFLEDGSQILNRHVMQKTCAVRMR